MSEELIVKARLSNVWRYLIGQNFGGQNFVRRNFFIGILAIRATTFDIDFSCTKFILIFADGGFSIAAFVQITILHFQVASLLHVKFQGGSNATTTTTTTTTTNDIIDRVGNLFNFRFGLIPLSPSVNNLGFHK